jgi:N-acetylglucosamine-6-sulfatase
MKVLARTDRLEDTVVVFLSDNGYFFGEHRLDSDKRLPLEPALGIPMAIRVGRQVAPGMGPSRADELVSQVDLAPTLLDYAGIDPCQHWERCVPMDGRSLRPLLENAEPKAWPSQRAIPLTLDDGWRYNAIRTSNELYMEIERSRWTRFDPPAVELYDLIADPDQLNNIAASLLQEDRSRLRRAQRRLRISTRCAGIEGRDTRSQGRPFCS